MVIRCSLWVGISRDDLSDFPYKNWLLLLTSGRTGLGDVGSFGFSGLSTSTGLAGWETKFVSGLTSSFWQEVIAIPNRAAKSNLCFILMIVCLKKMSLFNGIFLVSQMNILFFQGFIGSSIGSGAEV
jgi:hypothetical protein